MAAANATINVSIQYTPPSAALNSGNATFSTQASYTGQNVGAIVVNTTDSTGTTFQVPFNSIDQAKVVIVRNLMSSEVGIRINGSMTNNFNIPSGGSFQYQASSSPTSIPITSVAIVTTATPSASEEIHYYVFGS